MSMETFDNVFDALMDNPAEAANMTLRSDLMRAIRKEVQSWAGSQTAAARRLGVTQPRLNDLLRNRISKFSLDVLVTIASRVGMAEQLGAPVPGGAQR